MELMDKVSNDAAAEDARKELAAAIAAGLFTTRSRYRAESGVMALGAATPADRPGIRCPVRGWTVGWKPTRGVCGPAPATCSTISA